MGAWAKGPINVAMVLDNKYNWQLGNKAHCARRMLRVHSHKSNEKFSNYHLHNLCNWALIWDTWIQLHPHTLVPLVPFYIFLPYTRLTSPWIYRLKFCNHSWYTHAYCMSIPSP
jgi:hypothetical protein